MENKAKNVLENGWKIRTPVAQSMAYITLSQEKGSRRQVGSPARPISILELIIVIAIGFQAQIQISFSGGVPPKTHSSYYMIL